MLGQLGEAEARIEDQLGPIHAGGDKRTHPAVKLGLQSLDRGEYVSHEEVGARIDRLFPS